MSRAPGSYAGLTVAQAELLSFIRWEAEAGRTPSYEEMKSALGLASKSGVLRLLTALEERGFIIRLPNRARAIALVEEPTPLRRKPPEFSLDYFTSAELAKALRNRGGYIVVDMAA